MGRPSKLNPALQETICKSLSIGNYLETAAAVSGVSKSTVYDWLKRGAREKAEGKKSPYTAFSDAVEKAQAQGEQRLVLIIAKASEEHWQAAAWHLERKYPSKWGRRDTLDTNVNVGSDQERQKRYEELFDALEQVDHSDSPEGERVDPDGAHPDPEAGGVPGPAS